MFVCSVVVVWQFVELSPLLSAHISESFDVMSVPCGTTQSHLTTDLQLIGCALVGVGIWVLVDKKFKDLSAESEFAVLQYAGVALIVIGGIIMMVGFFGCCGAIRESQCLLVMVSYVKQSTQLAQMWLS